MTLIVGLCPKSLPSESGRRWSWNKLGSTTNYTMWKVLLLLSCLLYLVQPSHGYFYKENTVSDNDKQCFCEVGKDYFCCRHFPFLRDLWHVLLISYQCTLPAQGQYRRLQLQYGHSGPLQQCQSVSASPVTVAEQLLPFLQNKSKADVPLLGGRL